MPGLITCKFDEDRIKTEVVIVETSFYAKFSSLKASLETPFSHYKTTGNFLDAQGHLTPKGVV